jgi:hypothetical protein
MLPTAPLAAQLVVTVAAGFVSVSSPLPIVTETPVSSAQGTSVFKTSVTCVGAKQASTSAGSAHSAAIGPMSRALVVSFVTALMRRRSLAIVKSKRLARGGLVIVDGWR